MADKAQSEPTMEEILASIRKIIADDGESSRPATKADSQETRSVDVNVSDDDDFDDLSLEDVMAETESDDVNDPADNYFSNNQEETGRHADFDLMEKEDTSGSLLADVDDDMFDDLTSDEVTSNENDFAPEAPQPFEAQEDELEDFDLASGNDEDDSYVVDRPVFGRGASGATWTPEELAAPQTEADPQESEQAFTASDDEPDFEPAPAFQTEPDYGTEPDTNTDPLAGVAPQPEPVSQTEADDDSFMSSFDPAPPVEVEPETEPLVADMSQEEPEPEPTMTDTYTSQGSEGGDALTDERIAGAAATALGKLMVKRTTPEDEANPNTLDGLMRELLRPMIKEWLDANLPTIVERKVEEEVQRIARMAR
ncbi:DUF2497 domain-containing protein [Henriciella marina]|uniref:DUF2497 domain-containing protein n=1 Tax=Henriciella marina TaxID=453851 RepID=UPI0009FDF753|nr:DUF2497 domain-containing protein [Henriciella marina]